jgi:plastocyanin
MVTTRSRIATRITASLFMLLTLAAVLRPASARQKASPKTHNIAIKGFKFVPERLEVAVGDTVIWTNEDIVPHIVTADKFHSKSMDKGESWSFRPKQKGEFPYICRFHPTMKAELVVH